MLTTSEMLLNYTLPNSPHFWRIMFFLPARAAPSNSTSSPNSTNNYLILSDILLKWIHKQNCTSIRKNDTGFLFYLAVLYNLWWLPFMAKIQEMKVILCWMLTYTGDWFIVSTCDQQQFNWLLKICVMFSCPSHTAKLSPKTAQQAKFLL